MEYTVKKLAELAGITSRTLHWYDKIGLLRPGRTTQAGYRLYGPVEVDRLQQILFYRELGLPLAEIKVFLDMPGFDRREALQGHLTALRKRREQLDTLIETVERTILNEKGEITMSDQEKFEGLKKKEVEESERRYGAEARKKYGDSSVDEVKKAMMGLSPAKYENWVRLDKELRKGLENAVRRGETPDGKEGKRLAELHREWLTILMPDCDNIRQMGIAELYVSDPRFMAYYDVEIPGCARFLRDTVQAYMGNKD